MNNSPDRTPLWI